MSKTGQQLANKIGQLIEDTDNDRFSEQAKLDEVNEELVTYVSPTLRGYIRSDDIQLHEGAYDYDFPTDMMDVVSISTDNINGYRVVAMSYAELTHGDDLHQPFDIAEPSSWEPGSWSGSKYFVRDLTSDSQFILTPTYDPGTADNRYEADGFPDNASEGDFLTDTGDENAVWYCSGAYGGVKASLTWARTTTDLVFTAVAASPSYIQVAVVDGGATVAPAALVKSGTGTRSDPYVYTITGYDADNSNDALIALLDGDADLSADGSYDENESFTALAATQLTNHDNASLTWPRTTDDLVFFAVDTGTKYIQVAVVDADTTGTASLATVTGTGTRTDPYVYTFTLYSDSNSNEAIATALGSDANLAINNEGTTTEAFTAFSATALTNPAEAYWDEKVLHVRYTATLPELSLLTDELHSSLPQTVRETYCLAYLAAANLIGMDRGGDLTQAQIYRNRGSNQVLDSLAQRNRDPAPVSIAPR